MRGITLRAMCALSLLLLTGCAPAYWLGTKLYYREAELHSAVEMNIGYDPAALDDHKRQLDLYVPDGRDWPTIVFLHGGGWAWGDRAQRFGGADVYGNIGRFFAGQGFATAVAGYRLIWTTDWQTQVTDAARAVAWVQHNIAARGGNPGKIFLMGHSAGAQLAMRIATDARWLEGAGALSNAVCGVVAVSGVGYDMDDPVTERMDGDTSYYVQRFGGSIVEDPARPETRAWRAQASVLGAIDPADPPVLSLVGQHDIPSVHHQSRLADERLRQVGLSEGFVIVPGVDHLRIVLELSRPDHTATPAILRFFKETPCPRRALAPSVQR